MVLSFFLTSCFRLELLKALSDNGKDISYFEEMTGKKQNINLLLTNNSCSHNNGLYVTIDYY